MSKKSKVLICLATCAAAAWGSAGTAIAEEPVFYQVRILGPTALVEGQDARTRLTMFIQRLRTELMVGNLGEANIGCDRCGELVDAEKVEGRVPPARPLTSLQFTVLRNGSQLEAFARSYDFVQASELGAKDFKMEIDGTSPPGAVCTDAQIAAGCKTRTLCVQTDGCDKKYGGACNLCN